MVQHVVMLSGELVDFPAIHLLQLVVYDRSKTAPDGHDGRGRVECGWRLRAASFGFQYACRTRRILFRCRCIEVLLGRHLQTAKRYAVDTINCRQTPIRLPSRDR